MRKWGHVLLLGAILAAGAWFSLRDLTFISTDTGLRYLQARTFQEYGWRQVGIPYAGLQFDPGFRFVPYYQAFSRYGDELLLAISPFFPLVTAGFMNALGRPGLVVVPVLGTLLTSASVAGLWGLAGHKKGHWLFWGTAVATPLLFYSLTLWDHTIGVGLSTLAVYMAARGLDDRRRFWPLGAGALIALAVAQRAEVGLMVIALGLALLLVSWPRWQILIPYGSGGLLGLLVTAPLNQLWVGHPLGIVIARSYLGYLSATYHPFQKNVDLSHANIAARHLLSLDGGQVVMFVAALLLVVGSVFLALILRLPSLRRRALLNFCLVLIIAGTSLGLLPAREGLVTGLLTTLPLFGLALAYVDEPLARDRVYRLVFLAGWLYVGLALVVLRQTGGTQWGARYLLPAVPLLFFLAMFAVVSYRQEMLPLEARALTRVALVLVALSLVIQLAGLRALSLHKDDLRQIQRQIAALPTDVILTNTHYLASFMVPMEEKVFLYVKSGEDMALLAQRLDAQGVERFAALPLPRQLVALDMPVRAGNLRIVPEARFVYRLEKDETPNMFPEQPGRAGR